MNARTQAIARESASIEASQSRAIAAREAEQSKPRNALEAMAARLKISAAGLKNTLMNTVFAECKTEEQFMALIVVSNEFGLNPLTKEIYAFPAKGGGIVPMVSVDGWIRLMNEHPAFDGIEFNYHDDAKGDTQAVEAIIYRKDRTRPVKVIEYMAECKGSTGPWQKSPRRMLRHRALIQGVRVAFGFSGIAADGDEDVIDGGTITAQALPSRQSLAEELNDGIPALEEVDQETGEVLDRDPNTGRTVEDEETARALDAGGAEPEAAEDEAPAWAGKVAEIKSGISAAKNAQYLKAVEGEYLNHCAVLPKEVCDEIEDMLRAKRAQFNGGK